MYFEFAAIAAVVIFAVLAYYIIQALLSLQQALQRIACLSLELDIKIKQLDSTIQSISHIGDICEHETARLREQYLNRKEQECQVRMSHSDCSGDLAEWILASIKLGSKFIRRKKYESE